MNRIISWIKHEPVLLSFLTLAAGNLAADLEAGKVTLAVVGSALLAAFGAMVRTQVTPTTAGPNGVHVELLPESPHADISRPGYMHGRLGRHVEHDPRSRKFPTADSGAPLVSRRWTRRCKVLNQKNIGACTGNAAAGWAGTDNAARPGTAKITETTAHALYHLATEADSIPGTWPPDDTGSSGLAAAKALVSLGYATRYTHAFTVRAVLATLSHVGPVMIGSRWRTGMDSPDMTGRIAYTGSVRGGHEYLLDEIDVERRIVWLTNSWGPSWGVKGRAYLSFADLAALLADSGDATIPH